MKVKLLTSLSGVHGAFDAGDEYTCSVEEAERLVERGFAEHIRAEPVEKAVRKPRAEKAAK